MSRGAMIGRFPIRFISNKICFLSRCGKNIYVHEGTKELKFQRVAEIKVSLHPHLISYLSYFKIPLWPELPSFCQSHPLRFSNHPILPKYILKKKDIKIPICIIFSSCLVLSHSLCLNSKPYHRKETVRDFENEIKLN
jgi:hypothetical protein